MLIPIPGFLLGYQVFFYMVAQLGYQEKIIKWYSQGSHFFFLMKFPDFSLTFPEFSTFFQTY